MVLEKIYENKRDGVKEKKNERILTVVNKRTGDHTNRKFQKNKIICKPHTT